MMGYMLTERDRLERDSQETWPTSVSVQILVRDCQHAESHQISLKILP